MAKRKLKGKLVCHSKKQCDALNNGRYLFKEAAEACRHDGYAPATKKGGFKSGRSWSKCIGKNMKKSSKLYKAVFR